MKVFGGRTKTDILTGQNMPHFTGKNGHFSIKINEYNFLFIILFLKIKRIIVILFYAFFGLKKNKKPK